MVHWNNEIRLLTIYLLFVNYREIWSSDRDWITTFYHHSLLNLLDIFWFVYILLVCFITSFVRFPWRLIFILVVPSLVFFFCMFALLFIIIIMIIGRFSHQRERMVFYWILSNNKSPQVSQASSQYTNRS